MYTVRSHKREIEVEPGDYVVGLVANKFRFVANKLGQVFCEGKLHAESGTTQAIHFHFMDGPASTDDPLPVLREIPDTRDRSGTWLSLTMA